MRTVVLTLLAAATIVATVPRFRETVSTARDLATLETLEARRARLFGTWYVAVEALKRQVPPAATIDFVMLRPEARDIAVLAAAELQPRDVRLFDGWDGWRVRRRAILFHDDRAANAVVASPPPIAQFIVIVDPSAEPPLRITERPR